MWLRTPVALRSEVRARDHGLLGKRGGGLMRARDAWWLPRSQSLWYNGPQGVANDEIGQCSIKGPFCAKCPVASSQGLASGEVLQLEMLMAFT